MSDPTGGRGMSWQERKARRQQVMQRANQAVNEVNQELSSAREVYGPKHPTIKKLQADSVSAVETRHKAIKDYQEGI